MEKFQCIIVDDDITSIVLLEKYIERLNDFTVIQKFTNPIEAIGFLNNHAVDLIFLDVEMPSISGINFIKILSKKINVILTTASRQYALEGFDLDVVDYILKPINFERFSKAVEKFRNLHIEIQSKESIPALAIPKNSSAIFVKENYKTKKILITDIIYIESDKEYVKIFTNEGFTKTKQSLNFYDNEPDNAPFLRIHRSFVINLEKIVSFTNTEIQVANKLLPIGRNYREKVKQIISNEKNKDKK
jgi:DNA-binding LytR/AlgR family response regulator